MNIDTKMLNTFLLQIQTHFVANPAAHKKDHTPQPSWIHPWVRRMVQHTQISQCDTAHQKRKDENHMIISINTEKTFDKIQHPFMIESLTKRI